MLPKCDIPSATEDASFIVKVDLGLFRRISLTFRTGRDLSIELLVLITASVLKLDVVVNM
jgi:hypothetical protein